VTSSERRPLWVGTSWKMTKTLAEASAFIDELAAFPVPDGLQAFVLPAHTALASVRDRLPRSSTVLLGAQNAHWGPEGAGTGEISMRMAQDAGAAIIEIGHSERRSQFNETDQTVAAKVAAALTQGLIPLVCVGESQAVRRSGRAETFVAGQVRAALANLTAREIGQVIFAYEPIWAIGEAGRPATAADITPVVAAIIAAVAEVSGGRAARAVLYGGSVNIDNAGDLLSATPIDGLFIGRAAWAATDFIRLLQLSAGTLRTRLTV
jgi:triosephosphate isomerase